MNCYPIWQFIKKTLEIYQTSDCVISALDKCAYPVLAGLHESS